MYMQIAVEMDLEAFLYRNGGLFFMFLYVSTAASYSITATKNKPAVQPGEAMCLSFEMNTTEQSACHLQYSGTEAWVATSEPLFVKSLVFDDPGYFPVVVNCSDEKGESDIVEVEVPSVIPIKDVTIDSDGGEGDSSILLIVPAGSASAFLTARYVEGWPVRASAKFNNVSVSQDLMFVNTTSKTVHIGVRNTGKVSELELTLHNELSSLTQTYDAEVVEKLGDLYANVPETAVIGSSLLLSAVTEGTNPEYSVCISSDSNGTTCTPLGNSSVFNYTVSAQGDVNVTFIARNKINTVNKTTLMKAIYPVKGFTLTSSLTKASTTDDVQFHLKAPDVSHFPMGTLVVVFEKNGEEFLKPGLLDIQANGSHVVNSTFPNPGPYTISAAVANLFSSQKVNVTIRVSDPINAMMSISGNPWLSTNPLTVTVSNVAGWGFDYTLQFGDLHIQRSPTNATNITFGDTLVFNHTYTADKSFEIVFEASNLLYQQTLREAVTIIHPVPDFRIESTKFISIPTGWASFDLGTTGTEPAPTDASCSIDYADGTRKTLNVDWATGFPASHNYKSVGNFNVIITCENLLSSHSNSFLVTVDDRDIDIQGLKLTVPEFTVVNTVTDIGIAIESGTKVKYLISISDDFVEEVVDKPSDVKWTFRRTFEKTGQFHVTVNAKNSVTQLEASGTVSVVKEVTGFDLRITPSVASTLGDIDFTVHTPDNEKFPIGPVSVQFFKDNELLSSKNIQSPEANANIGMKSSRWSAGKYVIKAVITSPVSTMELQSFVITETPIPFFTFTADDVVTIPDGVVSYQMETRFDELTPTDASCVLSFGDGEMLTMNWDYKMTFNHTFYKSGIYNASMSCKNRVSQRELVLYLDICEFNADGFRFDYPRVVPLNSSSPSVNVRFKYNICGLTSLSSDSDMGWVFEPGSDVESKAVLDWEMEHVFRQRGSYDVTVYIKSRQTNTETTVTLPIRIGVLHLESEQTIGRVDQEVFNITVSGAVGQKVYYRVNFGEGKNVSAEKANITAEDHVVFSKIYQSAGTYQPRVLAWSQTFVEEIQYSQSFVVQFPITTFDLILEQESWSPPIFVSFTFHLKKFVSKEHVTCRLDAGDGTKAMVTFDPDVQRFYSLRVVHSYQNYGPFGISGNCSNLVSYSVNTGEIRLRTRSNKAPRLLHSPIFIPVFLFLSLKHLSLE